MKLYADQFSSRFDNEAHGEVRKTIIIASTPRSGSHMLGHSMIEAGGLGVPFEYVNPANLRRWREITGGTQQLDILRTIMRRRTTSNGVFAIKMHYSHLRAIGGLDACLDFFPSPHFVRIVRADILKQAISLVRARQTGVWISGQQGNGHVASYNKRLIRCAIHELVVDNAKWDSALQERNIRPLQLEFSDVAKDVGRSVKAIGELASVSLSTVPRVAPTKKQSSDDAREWLERYISSTHGGVGASGIAKFIRKLMLTTR